MKQVDGREGSELQSVHQGAIRAQSSLHLHTQILQQVQDHLETQVCTGEDTNQHLLHPYGTQTVY